ncbi:arsenate reductase/protein-tyrosine-phosphatase family protein [Raoultella ornithinolytica]|uniref:arsenate reductase/protein-tyrosine-phosphatase family protein n=1 Tax=Raoultella ornithinolytica TaxID=54291 RepID=UPI000F8244B2|nr:protein tyrosine phosphatase [Raoultella ornithinolytica]MDH7608865.1 protein tyrosine phosphatase [Raoultella ornithinolytica]
MFNSILVICTGNICRSPIGERVLQNMFPDKKVDSAGTSALVGKPADYSAGIIAKKYGLSLDGHLGKQFTPSLGRRYDLILVMEKNHLEFIGMLAPEIRGKTMLLGHWLEQKEIPDPYGKSEEAFDYVFNLIAESCRLWESKISR